MSYTNPSRLVVIKSSKIKQFKTSVIPTDPSPISCSSMTHHVVVDKEALYKPITPRGCFAIAMLPHYERFIKNHNKVTIQPVPEYDQITFNNETYSKRWKVLAEDNKMDLCDYATTLLPTVTSMAFKNRPEPMFQLSLVLHNEKAAFVNLDTAKIEISEAGISIYWNNTTETKRSESFSQILIDIAHLQNQTEKRSLGAISVTSSAEHSTATISLCLFDHIIRSNTIEVSAKPHKLVFETLINPKIDSVKKQSIKWLDLFRGKQLGVNEYEASLVDVSFVPVDRTKMPSPCEEFPSEKDSTVDMKRRGN